MWPFIRPPLRWHATAAISTSKADGIFRTFHPRRPASGQIQSHLQKSSGRRAAARNSLGKIEQPVATAPLDADFEKAAVWRITIPADVDLGTDPILRLHYVGDVARVMLDGQFITDDFYNGNAFDIGLRRHAPEILNGDLRIAILPLRKDAPIYMAEKARPNFGGADSVADATRASKSFPVTSCNLQPVERMA